MKFPKIDPEFRAQSNGVVLGLVVGWITCELVNLPEGLFFLLTIVSMFVLGTAFVAFDASRANAGKPRVTLRTLFWRGLSEALIGFVILLTIEAIQRAS